MLHCMPVGEHGSLKQPRVEANPRCERLLLAKQSTILQAPFVIKCMSKKENMFSKVTASSMAYYSMVSTQGGSMAVDCPYQDCVLCMIISATFL